MLDVQPLFQTHRSLIIDHSSSFPLSFLKEKLRCQRPVLIAAIQIQAAASFVFIAASLSPPPHHKQTNHLMAALMTFLIHCLISPMNRWRDSLLSHPTMQL